LPRPPFSPPPLLFAGDNATFEEIINIYEASPKTEVLGKLQYKNYTVNVRKRVSRKWVDPIKNRVYYGTNFWRIPKMAAIETEQEKERLTNILAAQYAQSLIAIDEYERLLDFVNKTETNKEIEYIRKIINTNETYALKEKTADRSQFDNYPKINIFAMLINLLVKKQNIKKIKIFSGSYELRLYDIDFVENRLILKIKKFGGDAFIYIAKNTSVENNVQIYSGKCVMNERIDISNSEIKNKLIINGANFSGNIYIIYEK
jgi:hypothetical protein